MSSLLIDNIGALVTNDPAQQSGLVGLIEDAAIVFDDGVVAWVGPRTGAPDADDRVDADGRAVIPGFVDSHSHLVFSGDRSAEFAARMAGKPYSAGGINTTVNATRAASTDELRANVARLIAESRRSGTTTNECKSGYGLTVDTEVQSLQLAAEFTDEITFLGAHLVPQEYADRPDDYVDLVCTAMVDACAPAAKWIDVFCERGAFDGDQTRKILTAGVERGLIPRVHANQLGPGPGVQIAVEFGAASADHATFLDDDDIAALASGTTVATLLAATEFATRTPYPDARRLLDAGVTVALASNCNPGSGFTTNLPFCIAVAVRDMFMTPDEALWSATMGGARALRRTDVGHLGVGARADAVLLDAISHVHLAYRPGVPLVGAVWRGGELVAGSVGDRSS
ncbi:imidazolonepropionase [Mycobacterium dioxanotrophicus]|uniref:Imidazolonepropionase n=1 Tax=Mycobacterium dioxanotrophicus TaxID=482462 RepID=A0A1Y0CD38_9MYCO|nr:imidazolonepropionase [Mycobacterium dioxanotrophicus]ART72964.1 imidazolonepropionase [Mycobacterium dioxanotrophicus]